MNNQQDVRQKMAAMAMARSQLYELFALVFMAEPTGEFLRAIKEPRLSMALSELGINLGKEFQEKSDEELLEELAIEYTRLFLGPGQHISANESVFMETDGGGGGSLWGEKTVEVKRFIETTGLEYVSSYTGFPDHVSVELKFLGKLTGWEANQWEQNNTGDAQFGLSVEQKFIKEHLIKWVPKLCSEITSRANLPFYREMARITKDFIKFDYENISEYLSLE